MGRYQDAANEHLARGRTKEAIEVIKSDCGSDDGLTRAAKYSLDVVWQKVSFGQKLKASNTAAIEFLKLASTIKPRLRSPSQRDQVGLNDCNCYYYLTSIRSSHFSMTCVLTRKLKPNPSAASHTDF